VDVELQRVHAQRDGLVERLHRVFGSMRGVAPVADYRVCAHVEEGMGHETATSDQRSATSQQTSANAGQRSLMIAGRWSLVADR
jgi:hypothetical protein